MLSPIAPKAYDLLHQGTIALAQVEDNGICIDVEYCKQQSRYLDKKIQRLESNLDKTKAFKLWKKVYKNNFKIDSGPQLGHILFDLMKLKPTIYTGTGEPSVSQEALAALKLDFVDDLIHYRKYMKAKNTYLANLIEEAHPETHILHPFFHLHTVQTYRSSSSNPNWQNIPARDAEIKRVVRRAIRPRKNHYFVEIDYSGVEVKIASCYHHDPTMLKYIHDPSTDMHRDMSQQCFILGDDEWTSMTRYCAKNMFVFPQFYGDYFISCARNMWNACEHLNLTTSQGTPVRDHLKKKGIKTLKQFESHIKKVEDDFWNRRFGVYNKWKNKHVAEYERNGWFDLKTGFRCQGIMRRNEVINYPVQGAAFHCLLWSLIQVNKFLLENEYSTCIIGQIHDSLILDVHQDELDTVLRKCEQVMCEDLRKHWDWIIVPIGIEIEVSPLNKSWYEKDEVFKKICPSCGHPWMWKGVTKDTDGNIIEFYYKCVCCEKHTEPMPI